VPVTGFSLHYHHHHSQTTAKICLLRGSKIRKSDGTKSGQYVGSCAIFHQLCWNQCWVCPAVCVCVMTHCPAARSNPLPFLMAAFNKQLLAVYLLCQSSISNWK
jgi:hypothetical protein